jgi:heme O synthase-like polyprenyltransferase
MNKKLQYWIAFTVGLPFVIFGVLIFAIASTLDELMDKCIDRDMRKTRE